MHAPQSQSPSVVHESGTQLPPAVPAGSAVQRVLVAQAGPPSSHGIGSQWPFASLQRWPSAQDVLVHAGAQYGQQPPMQIIPSPQSVSVPHAAAQPVAPQMEPTTQLPHSQSASERQSSAVGTAPGQ